MKFDLAILYWFYKEPEVTKNHLELIRKNNPNVKIFGLFGGEPDESNDYKELLGDLLDDFWLYEGTYGTDSYSKWVHGDLMLLDWYDKRGRDLGWDSIATVQWDMLLFTDIRKIVPGLNKNQIYFSGYRELDDAVENRWSWTKPDGKHRQDYLDFCDFVDKEYGYKSRLKICLFIFQVLTREFFEKYMQIPNKKVGMLEYKDPTLANIFGLDIYELDIGVLWQDKGQHTENSPLNALPIEIKAGYIIDELKREDGWRLFHPYKKEWPLG